jgi:hypothetical protein
LEEPIFAHIAKLREDAAAQSLLFLRKHGYRPDKLARLTGMPIERVIALQEFGIRRLYELRWASHQIAATYRMTIMQVEIVLRRVPPPSEGRRS